MDARTRKLVGWGIAAVGVVIAIIGALADQIGIGSDDDAAAFGGRQVAVLIVGVVVLAIGLAVAYLWRPAAKESSSQTDASPSSTPSPSES
ncbi:MAG TPA: hypothetical protein VE575_15350 [Acidimicrobiales bacterium]|jgi:hypothetical protein|nr:hypothetical protein [Acidimicrobiales bacterium]